MNEVCYFCGSDAIVRLTPTVAGPDGWGFRCKACQKNWSLLTVREALEKREGELIRMLLQMDEETDQVAQRVELDIAAIQCVLEALPT